MRYLGARGRVGTDARHDTNKQTTKYLSEFLNKHQTIELVSTSCALMLLFLTGMAGMNNLPD